MYKLYLRLLPIGEALSKFVGSLTMMVIMAIGILSIPVVGWIFMFLIAYGATAEMFEQVRCYKLNKDWKNRSENITTLWLASIISSTYITLYSAYVVSDVPPPLLTQLSIAGACYFLPSFLAIVAFFKMATIRRKHEMEQG